MAATLNPPIIFEIAQDLTKMQVDTNVAESDIGKIRLGQLATFMVDSYTGTTFKDLVTEIRKAPIVTLNVITYDVVIAVDNSDSAQQELHAAQSAAEAASFQVEEANSALLVTRDGHSDLPTPLRSPANGRVLRLIEQSERVVAPGTPILEIGFTPRLEIVADFLTRDAVRIKPGIARTDHRLGRRGSAPGAREDGRAWWVHQNLISWS